MMDYDSPTLARREKMIDSARAYDSQVWDFIESDDRVFLDLIEKDDDFRNSIWELIQVNPTLKCKLFEHAADIMIDAALAGELP